MGMGTIICGEATQHAKGCEDGSSPELNSPYRWEACIVPIVETKEVRLGEVQ